jgi:hypothetical protein
MLKLPNEMFFYQDQDQTDLKSFLSAWEPPHLLICVNNSAIHTKIEKELVTIVVKSVTLLGTAITHLSAVSARMWDTTVVIAIKEEETPA